MSRGMLPFVGLIVFAVMLAAGQILFKLSAMRTPAIGELSEVRHLLLDPVLWAALVLYGAATLLWVILLQRVPLTYAYPFAALAFVIVPLAAAVFFDERLNLNTLIGSGLIVAGICVSVAAAST